MDDFGNSQKKQAWISCLKLLAATPKTRRELDKRLIERGFDKEIVEETLNRLEEQGLLSDRAYASNLLQKYTEFQPSGRRKIAFEMKRRGVSPKLCEELLAKIDPEEELKKAREVAFSRWEKLKGISQEKREKRVYDFLIRRGFDFQICRDLIDEFLESGSDA